MCFKASEQGKTRIREALQERGLGIQEKQTFDALEQAGYPVAEATWKRFVYGTRPIRGATFKGYCQFLQLDWSEIIDCPMPGFPSPQDWDSAPIESHFYGRDREFVELKQWFSPTSRCQLGILYGMGGIGKTALAAKLANQLKQQFTAFVWQSYAWADPVERTLIELLDRLSPSAISRTERQSGLSLRSLETKLLEELRRRRILIVLDEQNLEETECVEYRATYQRYRSLLQKISLQKHQSHLLVTIREKPSDITVIANGVVQAYCLTQLDENACFNILRTKELIFDEQSGRELVQRYGGNPLALKLVASVIQSDLFQCRVEEFLVHTLVVPEPIEMILEQHWKCLNPLERAILCCLATVEPLHRDELRQQPLLQNAGSSDFIKAMSALERRSLLAKVSEGHQVFYTLQPMTRQFFRRYLL
ncbi:MAG TPA: NB-ARC domain-containing protein [Trichocoleus sp.]|jgi:hypothetical protein